MSFQLHQDDELVTLCKHLLTPGKPHVILVSDPSPWSGLLLTPSPQALHGSPLDASASSPFLKSMKLEVQRFDSSNSLKWISRIDRFFNFHGKPDALRLQIVAFHLDGPVTVWYGLMENNNLISNWSSFLREVHLCFGLTMYEDPRGCLSKLLQTSSVADYHASFEQLLSLTSGLDVDLILSLFISGLKQKI